MNMTDEGMGDLNSDDDYSPNLITSSQTSSLPSPVILHKLTGPDGQYILPGPVGGAIAAGLDSDGHVAAVPDQNRDWISLLANITASDRIIILHAITPQLRSLSGVSEQNLNSLTKLVGAQINSEIKTEANYYRSKRSLVVNFTRGNNRQTI